MKNFFIIILSVKKKDHRSGLKVIYALRTFLPLRRRAASTLRPFLVLILLRNPCTLLRFLTLGLNVGLILCTSLQEIYIPYLIGSIHIKIPLYI